MSKRKYYINIVQLNNDKILLYNEYLSFIVDTQTKKMIDLNEITQRHYNLKNKVHLNYAEMNIPLNTFKSNFLFHNSMYSLDRDRETNMKSIESLRQKISENTFTEDRKSKIDFFDKLLSINIEDILENLSEKYQLNFNVYLMHYIPNFYKDISKHPYLPLSHFDIIDINKEEIECAYIFLDVDNNKIKFPKYNNILSMFKTKLLSISSVSTNQSNSLDTSDTLHFKDLLKLIDYKLEEYKKINPIIDKSIIYSQLLKPFIVYPTSNSSEKNIDEYNYTKYSINIEKYKDYINKKYNIPLLFNDQLYSINFNPFLITSGDSIDTKKINTDILLLFNDKITLTADELNTFKNNKVSANIRSNPIIIRNKYDNLTFTQASDFIESMFSVTSLRQSNYANNSLIVNSSLRDGHSKELKQISNNTLLIYDKKLMGLVADNSIFPFPTKNKSFYKKTIDNIAQNSSTNILEISDIQL